MEVSSVKSGAEMKILVECKKIGWLAIPRAIMYIMLYEPSLFDNSDDSNYHGEINLQKYTTKQKQHVFFYWFISVT